MTTRDLTVPSNNPADINDKLGLLGEMTQNLSETGKLKSTAIDGVIAEASGGTGESTYTDGQLLIGNSQTRGLNKATLAAGANVTITNGNGTVSIAAAAGGGIGNVTGPASAVSGDVVLFNGTTGKLIQDAGKGVPVGAIVGTTDSQTLSSKTLTLPTIGDFSNATHGHQNAAGGGTLDAAAVATGQLLLARGGTGSDLSATGGANQVLRQSAVGAVVTVSQLAAADVSGLAASATTDTTNAANISSGTLPAGRLPALTGDITTSAGTVATTLATVSSTSGTTGDASHVAQVTTNAKGLVTAQSSVAIVITPTAAGLSNVTNDAQTKAAVVPNTAPSAGQILVGNAGGTAYAPQTMGTDATLASSGAITIAAGAVTLAKQANMATASVVYRKTAGSGAPEVNTLATLKTDLGLTGTNSGDQTITLTSDVTGSGTGSFATTVAANAVTDAKFRQSGALAVVGRSANTTGNTADIQATAASGAVLRESGSVLGFGTVATAGIAANAVTLAKMDASTGTANKVLMSSASASPVWSTPTYPNASATSGKTIRSDGTNWIASTATLSDAPSTAGKILVSDGTNWITSTPTYPNASASAGKIIRSDGTNFVATTATYPATTTLNQILYSSAASTISEITAANNAILVTSASGVPSLTATTWTAFTPTLTASAGTFSVSTVNTARYRIVGKTMDVTILISGATISGTPQRLSVLIPASATAAALVTSTISYNNAGTVGTGNLQTTGAGATTLDMYRDISGTVNWLTSSANGTFGFTFTFEIQ